MTNTLDITATALREKSDHGLFKRSVVLAYGVCAYVVGAGGLFWLILAMGGIVPVGQGAWQTGSVLNALLINAGLIVLFGLQHSVMARANFKSWLTRHIPQAAERATYMLMSGLATGIAIYFWQPLPGTVWSVDNLSAKVLMFSLYAAGWGYLLLATFVTNHFELMGLRQVYLYFRNIPYTPLPFTRKYMYRYSRHPMMLGLLFGVWSIPVMSFSHFVLSLCLTVYMAIGVMLEERDLMKNFGETYRKYKKEIATFVPRIF